MRFLKRFTYLLSALVGLMALVWALPFLTLDATFVQELWSTSSGFMGGIAFAPDGDVWVTDCANSGGTLRRFDTQTTALVSGTLVHPQVATVATNTGCGIANHPNGSMYSNTSLGLTRQNESTGAATGGPFGPIGNHAGIAVHPATLELVYVAQDGTLIAADPNLTTTRTFSTALTGKFIDGIYFDPQGQFLFTATRSGRFRVSVLNGTSGALIQNIPMTSEPDGIAFHVSQVKFVVTNNTDGTMSRFDFPNDDFTQPPFVSLFGSGGFRGDLCQVGADGCLYVTQNGTRFNDGTTNLNNSIVRICPGFSPPPGVSDITLGPLTATNLLGQSHTVTAHVEVNNVPQSGILVTFTIVSGPNSGQSSTDLTDVNGDATFTYSSSVVGIDTIQASFDNGSGTIIVSNSVTKEWIPSCTTLNFQTEDDLITPLVNGQHINTEFGRLVTITSSGTNAGACIFDSTLGGPNDPSQDLDLLANTGNILILQTENFPPNGSDVFPRPNDDGDGGTLTFSFASEIQPRSVRLVDLDTTDGTSTVKLTDAVNKTRTYTVPSNWTGDRTLSQPGQRTLDLMTLAPQPGFGSTATASELAGFDGNRVVRIDVHPAGSGGMDDLSWCPPGAALQHAGALVRNGSNVNPLILSSLATPVLGGSWVVALNCAGHANSVARLSVYGNAAPGLPSSRGEVLVASPRLFQRLQSHTGSLIRFVEPIPNSLELIGLHACVQGVVLGSPGARLSNALDITLGF